jgi:hypothetical protein
MMSKAIVKDGIILPDFVSRNREHYAAQCEKVNQSIQVLWRQKLSDGTLPRIPQDQGLPTYTVCGAQAEIKLRDIPRVKCRGEGILNTLYAGSMSLAKIEGSQWAFNAVMARDGEEPMVPPEVMLQRPQLSEQELRDCNCYMRECAQEAQNIDKGFARYLKHFRVGKEVRASIQRGPIGGHVAPSPSFPRHLGRWRGRLPAQA